MANVLAELFQNTAAAIREKTGETGTMKPAEFPDKIRAIETGGTVDADITPYVLLENPAVIPNGKYCNNFAWHPDGKSMVIISTGGVYLYDTSTEPYTYIAMLEGSDSSVAWSAVYCNGGTVLIVIMGGTDATGVTVKAYDATVFPYMPIACPIPSDYTTYAYFQQGRWSELSPNGEILCITGSKGWAVFDTTTSPYTLLHTYKGNGQPYQPLFSHDGATLYIYSASTIYTHSYSSSYKVDYYAVTLSFGEDKTVTLKAGMGTTNKGAYSVLLTDTGKLISEDAGTSLSMYREGTVASYRTFTESPAPWNTILFDPTGRYITSGCGNGLGIRMTEILENGVRYYDPIPDFQNTTRRIKYSPDGKKFWIGTSNTSNPLLIYGVS